jgi:hypothetical protein
MKALLATTAVAVSVLLAACGGGDEGIIVEQHDPSPSGLAATITASAATDANLNGVYSSTNLNLNNVTKVNPIGGDPETCRFRFNGLMQAGSTRMMDGDVRYIPGNPELRTTVISIAAVEFRLLGSAGAAVDRTNNRVNFTGATFTATAPGSSATITLTGAIPMRGDRPEGC